MHSITRKLHGERRLPTPEWATNDAKLRRLLIRFLEGILRPHYEESDAARLARVDKHQRDNESKLQTTLTNLCREYTALKGAEVNFPRQRQLQTLIQGVDTQIRLQSNRAGLVARIVYLYYRVGYDSVGTSEAIGGINPVLVRRVLFQLRKVWARMAKEESAPKRSKSRECSKCGATFTAKHRQRCFACVPAQRRKRGTS